MSRVSSLAYNQNWTQIRRSVPGGSIIGSSSGSFASFSSVITRADIVKTPRPWPVPLKPLAYSYSIVRKEDLYGQQIYYDTFPHSSYITRTGNLAALIGAMSAVSAPAITAGQRNTCVVRALLNLKDQKVNVAQAFAEAHQVVTTIGDAVKTVCLAARAVKRGSVLQAAKLLGVSLKSKRYRKAVKRLSRKEFAHLTTAHRHWLSLQYGWKPMLMDIDGAAREFADRNTANPKRFLVTVGGSNVVKNSFVQNISAGGNNAYSKVCFTKQEIKIKLWFCLSNQTLATAASQGWSNPASLAWELLPFSFVADWFIPIGSYLNTLDATNGWDYVTGFRSEYLEGISKNPWFNPSIGNQRDFIGGYLRGYTRNVSFTRSVYGTTPLPELPKLKNPMSGTHLANAIALVKEVFGHRH